MWAAAGTWNDVFGNEPHKLVEASEGIVTDLKRDWSRRALDTLTACNSWRA